MFQNKFEIKIFENGREIILGTRPCRKKHAPWYQMQLVQDLSETNQTRIFLNCMKLSSLYRSRFLKYW